MKFLTLTIFFIGLFLSTSILFAQSDETIKLFLNEIKAFNEEPNSDQKAVKLLQIQTKIKNVPGLEGFSSQIPYYQATLLAAYAETGEWTKFKKLEGELTNQDILAQTRINIASDLRKKNRDLGVAEELARSATEFRKNNWLHPITKHDEYTERAMEKDRRITYAQYESAYSMVLYRLTRYQEGFELAKEAMMIINGANDPDYYDLMYNSRYILLAQHVLPLAELKPQLEQFVREGKVDSEAQDVLKWIYISENKTDKGYDDYLSTLKKNLGAQLMNQLKKEDLNIQSPLFELTNLAGEKINNENLKGKLVFVYFWSTWCGPCRAAFPVMQQLIDSYVGRPDVKFIFIDTWETAEDKTKKVLGFLHKSSYSFDVAMDNDDKVASQFEVKGLPTKFVLDAEGKIRFKILGYDGNGEMLKTEIKSMMTYLSKE